MRKEFAILCVIVALCLSLTGCKSSDYKQATELEQVGDYAAALAIYESLDGYEDSADRIATCNAMIAAIEKFSAAAESVNEKNMQLDTAISNAKEIISQNYVVLDNTLASALETAISECKAVKSTVPEMPENEDEIIALAEDLNAVDYTVVLSVLAKSQSLFERSVQQYALVNAPSESYIIECLMGVPGIDNIAAVTEENDPNSNLNKAGGYTAQVYFSSILIDQNTISGATVIEKGTDCGGSIEVYSSVEDAEKRNTYLAAFDGTIFASGSHTIIGTVVVRTSNELTASQQKELEANIINALTSLD